MEPYYQDDAVTLYHGDAVDLLRGGLELTIDAIVCDPPYATGTTEFGKRGSGSMVRGQKWSDAPIFADQMTTVGYVWLMRAFLIAARDRMPDGASALIFTDWRQWSHLAGAVESSDMRVQQMVVWDKGHMGMGNGFRTQHELILHAARGVPTIHNRSCPNVITAKRDNNDLHPSPKPLGLMQRLIEVVAEPGATVVDPFAGSGSTLRAAKDLGRKAIGFEIDERFCEITADRLSQGCLPLESTA